MIYATSDLHGYDLEKFKALLKKADFSDEDYCFVLGDVIDRGAHGVELLRWMSLQPNVELILGNHEAMLLSCDFLFDAVTEDSMNRLTGDRMSLYIRWLRNGAQPTVDALRRLPPEERADLVEYLRDAPLYETVSCGERDFILTHGGLGNFSEQKKMREYRADELLWYRPTITERYFSDIMTVFGHTPTLFYGKEYAGRAIFTDTWIDIDTGAACGLAPMLLRLDDLTAFYAD